MSTAYIKRSTCNKNDYDRATKISYKIITKKWVMVLCKEKFEQKHKIRSH